MKPKIIKNDAEHAAALARIDEIFQAEPGAPEGDELELLTMLVEQYEEKAFPIDLPDPVEAIRFRMEQQGLNRKDLERFIGSASKVSEVLSGKRELSLNMIRRLHEGLNIPADVLLRERGAVIQKHALCDEWSRFPLAVMRKRGWFESFHGTLSEVKEHLEEVMNEFAKPLGLNALVPSLNRQGVRSSSEMDDYSLLAWRMRVATLAVREEIPPYQAGTVKEDFIRRLAQLSYLDDGPVLAKEFLNKSGIHLVFERHLPKTHLDGAVFSLPSGSPVVALTLRHDRLDNFWYTLAHELAHLALHLNRQDQDAFFDDLDAKGHDQVEKEADELAQESLIPTVLWRSSRLSSNPTRAGVSALANELQINPAIPAGRARYERNDYRLFDDLVGRGKVRRLFE